MATRSKRDREQTKTDKKAGKEEKAQEKRQDTEDRVAQLKLSSQRRAHKVGILVHIHHVATDVLEQIIVPAVTHAR